MLEEEEGGKCNTMPWGNFVGCGGRGAPLRIWRSADSCGVGFCNCINNDCRGSGVCGGVCNPGMGECEMICSGGAECNFVCSHLNWGDSEN